jgi:hypothetical protein
MMKKSNCLKATALYTMLTFAIFAAPAQASVVQSVNMTFQSGATFSGQVTFANDFSIVEAVTGTLNGYQFGTNGYLGSGSDSINWVWSNGANFSSGADNYSTFLMDGPGSGYSNSGIYSNWIQFAYNYSGAPNLTFTSGVSYGAYDNYVDYQDPLVSGSIGAVPEPGSLTLLGLGFTSMGAFVWMKRRKAQLTAV